MHTSIILFVKIALPLFLYITATVTENGKGNTSIKKTILKRENKQQTSGKKSGDCIKVYHLN